MWKSPAGCKISELRGGGDAPGAREEILGSPWKRPWWCKLYPCRPWRSIMEYISTSSPEGMPFHSKGVPEEGCAENSCWTTFLAGAVACGEESIQKQGFWQRLWLVGDPFWTNQFLKDSSLWEEFTLEQFWKNGILWCGYPILKHKKNAKEWQW